MSRIKFNQTRKSSFKTSMKKLSLVIRRDRRVQFSILSFVVFAIFFASSFYILPLENDPSGNSLNFAFRLQPGTSTTDSYNILLPPGAYLNISYNVPSGSTGSFSIYGKPYGFLVSGSFAQIVDENVTGTGSYSYHNANTAETIIYTLSAARGNTSGSPDFIVSENPYYYATFNPYIFMLAIFALVISCVGMASSIMRMEKNVKGYYTKLGWDDNLKKNPFEEENGSEMAHENFVGKNHPRKMNPLVFFTPGLLFYIFGVIVGQSSSGGYLFLSILSYGIATAFVFGALLALLLKWMQ